MARTLLFSGSFLAVVGAIGFAGCSDDPTPVGTGGSSATDASSASSTASSTASSSSAGGAGGMGGMGGTAGTGGMGGAAGMGGSAGSGGTGGSAGSGGMGGAAGSGGMGAGGGTGGAGGMEVLDPDKDGWTKAEGDCCENEFECSKPSSVNPGAFEYPGNGYNDDCDDGTTSDVAAQPDCTDMPLAVPTTSLELVRAMDLCQFTTENPALPQRKWGVISSTLVLADGSNAIVPNDLQVGVLSNYGPNVTPRRGATMVALSTGTARDEGDAGYKHPQNGPDPLLQKGNFVAGTKVSAPPDYLAANGGKLPSPAACPDCQGMDCTSAFDSVNLKLRIRVPTNAKSFSYRVKSYSAEYPEFTCAQYNDFFLTLLKSSWIPDPLANPPQVALPVDGNIAKDSLGNALTVNNAFYEVCYPYVGAPVDACPSGTLELVGTGMGGWNNDLKDGGGTEWLISEAPVVPGEKIDLEFIIADSGDSNVDSIVLLDYFRWGLEPAPVGIHK